MRRRALLRRDFWEDHMAECAAITRGEVVLVWTPVGVWLKTRKALEPNGHAAATP